jgi:hypothetical protein
MPCAVFPASCRRSTVNGLTWIRNAQKRVVRRGRMVANGSTCRGCRAALCSRWTKWTRKLNAEQNLALLWRRLVAALSLIAAAVLAPSVSVSVSGTGIVGSRAGTGAAVASVANALIASSVDALVEGGQRKVLPEASGGTHAKAWALPASHELARLASELSSRAPDSPNLHQPRAVRSGLSRAPPPA